MILTAALNIGADLKKNSNNLEKVAKFHNLKIKKFKNNKPNSWK